MSLTSRDIRVAMASRFKAPEWAIMWEVAPATGAVRKMRYADAVMMSLWPSRGLDLHGVEIKISRSDWKREAADPEKAEMIAAYCDFWWLHVAPGVVQDLSEVPTAWGLREFDGKAWRTLREATRTEAKPCDRGFLAALLRRAEGRELAAIEDEVQRRVHEVTVRVDERIKAEVEDRTRRNSKALQTIAEFEAASGLSMEGFTWPGDVAELAKAVKLARDAGVDRIYSGIRTLTEQAEQVAAQLRKAVAAYDAGGEA